METNTHLILLPNETRESEISVYLKARRKKKKRRNKNMDSKQKEI